MLTKLNTKNLGFFNPDRGTSDPKACDQANTNGNFWGESPCKLAPHPPFVDVVSLASLPMILPL